MSEGSHDQLRSNLGATLIRLEACEAIAKTICDFLILFYYKTRRRHIYSTWFCLPNSLGMDTEQRFWHVENYSRLIHLVWPRPCSGTFRPVTPSSIDENPCLHTSTFDSLAWEGGWTTARWQRHRNTVWLRSSAAYHIYLYRYIHDVRLWLLGDFFARRLHKMNRFTVPQPHGLAYFFLYTDKYKGMLKRLLFTTGDRRSWRWSQKVRPN